MTTWLTLRVPDTEVNATTDAIKLRAVTQCGARLEATRDGVDIYFSQYGSAKLTQDQILYCQQTAGLDFDGALGQEYYLILPISVANANVPVGFPDRTYIDENEQEVIRKVKDYVAFYRISQDGLTALVRCTHTLTNEDTSGVSLDPDDFVLWYNVAMNQSVHTAISPDGLIEHAQAEVLLNTTYTVPE